MKIVSAQEVNSSLSFPALIDDLQSAFANDFSMPPRNVYQLDDSDGNHEAVALLPSWNDQLIGVKAFAYFPHNPKPNYKSVYSKVLLFDREHGEPLALVDGTSVTYWRTAGISGLATRLLSREDSKTLLLLGTGNLAPYIVRANISVRPIDHVIVWGRTPANAEKVVKQLNNELGIQCSVASDLQVACAQADIVVSATGAHEPLVVGDWVKPGTHTDFLGNHLPTKRECDTGLVAKAKVYVDSFANCLNEAGEILVPIAEGAFTKEHVIGELAGMCAGNAELRMDDDEITFFKSVGTALADLVGAGSAFEAIKNQVN